jgi:hypothetical protein
VPDGRAGLCDADGVPRRTTTRHAYESVAGAGRVPHDRGRDGSHRGVRIDGDEPGEVLSLILQRTPKYEGLLPPEERGVRVSHERYREHDEDFLRRVRLAGGLVEVETTSTRYRLDVARVEPAKLRRARRVLERMNFDRRFALETTQSKARTLAFLDAHL